MYEIEKIQYLQIGVQGENLAMPIEIDMTAWAEKYPNATFHVLFKPYNETDVCPQESDYDSETKVLTWTVGAGATAVVGVGYTEIRAQDGEGLIKKTRVIPTSVENSVSGVEVNPPAAYAGWVTNVLNAATAIIAAAHGTEIGFSIDDDGHLVFSYTDEDEQTVEVDLGPVDAYGLAVTKGYEGTREEFAQYMADVLSAVDDAEASANAAAASAAEAQQYTVAKIEEWLDDHLDPLTADTPLDRNLALPNAAAPADMVGDLKSALDYIDDAIGAGYKVIKGYYIDNTGKIVAGATYDTFCFFVENGGVIGRLTSNVGLVYAFYVNEPNIGDSSYNNSRVVLSTESSVTNLSVPSGVNWIAVRTSSGGSVTISPESVKIGNMEKNGLIYKGNYTDSLDDIKDNSIRHIPSSVATSPFYNKSACVLVTYTMVTGSYMQVAYGVTGDYKEECKIRTYVSSSWTDWSKIAGNAFKQTTALGSIDFNDYRTTGFFMQTAVSATSGDHSPLSTLGGWLLVFNEGNYPTQIYICNLSSTIGRVFVRKASNTTWSSWSEVGIFGNAKVAFFGDSIIWGSIKTVSGSEFVTTQANPTPAEVVARQLHCTVDNFAVGGMGYIKKAGAQNRNIYEEIQATNLTGYTHLLIVAGDNDSSVGIDGIGSYTDTTQDTIMGQMYRIMSYLHTNYPTIIPIIIDKNNKVCIKNADGTTALEFGQFPTYYYDFTYPVHGYQIKKLFEETEKFCTYYGVGHVRYTETCLNGWILQEMVGPDGTHYSQDGYIIYGKAIAAQLSRFI